MKEIAIQAQISSSFKLEKTAFTKKLALAYFNIFEYTVTRLLLTKSKSPAISSMKY